MNFDVLSEKTPVFGHRVLEASAGTGKTFAIEHLVVRLIIAEEERERVSLPEILVVTFTQAAARELKARIRSNLEKALKMLQEEDNSVGYLAALQNKSKGAERLKEALLCYDEANIFTIHGFCLRAMKEFAFESNSLLEEEELGKKFYPYVKRFLRALTPSTIHPAQLGVLLQREEDIEGVSKKLIQEMGKKKAVCPVSWMEPWHVLKQVLAEKNPYQLLDPALLKEDFSALYSQYKKGKVKEESLVEEIEILCEIAIQKNCSEELFWRLAASSKLVSFFTEENRKKKYTQPNLRYPGFLSWVEKEIDPILKGLMDPEVIRKRLAFFLQEELSKEEGFLTHDEILRKMHLSLQKESFLKRMKGKYQAAIIDEFQDTDPIQWEIFSGLFLKEPAIDVFYIVGDPKQSIYGFRSADVYTYLEAAKTIGKENTFILDTNFRSIPSLTGMLNSLFQGAPWLYLPKAKEFLTFLPVRAGIEEKEESQDERKPLHFFVAEEGAKSERWPSVNVERMLLFPFIAKEIRDLSQKGRKFSEFAILVRDRYQGKNLEEFLNELEIPCQRKRSSQLSESLALSYLKEIFRAVREPEDESRVKIALLGPFIGYTLAEILEMGQNLPVEPFYLLRSKLQKEGIAAFFSLFFQTTWKESVLEKMAKNPSFYQDTLELTEHLLEFSQKEQVPIERWEGLLEEWEKDDPEEKKKQFSSEEDAVQILTTHMSKGLEFGVVFALGLASRSPSQEGEEEEQDAEKLRQLYVALTRAKKRLYVPLLFDNGKRDLKKGEAAPLELFFGKLSGQDPYLEKPSKERILALLESYFSEGKASYSLLLPEKIRAQKRAAFSLRALNPPPETLPNKKRSTILSFSGLKMNTEDKKPSFSSADPVSPIPSGAEFGIFVHKVLEILLTSESLKEGQIEEVVRREMLFYPYDPFEKEIVQLIKNALYTPLIQGRDDLALAQIPYEKKQVEVEFFSPFASGKEQHFLKGFIDIVFSAGGKYYLLDWKTNDLGGSGNYAKENLEKVLLLENYHIQAAIYTDALQRFLRKVDPRPFSECFGGMFYVFLRGLQEGKGILHFIPDLVLLHVNSLHWG